MTDFKAMADDDLELWIRNRPGIDPHPDGGWYTGSVDAALTLPFGPYMIKLDQTMTVLWECSLRWGGEDLERYTEYAATPARAICEAWCIMQEAEND